MKLTKIAISYGESASHPLSKVKPKMFSHSQIRPSLLLEAELEDGDQYEEVRNQLFTEARSFVQNEIGKAYASAKQENTDGE